MATVETSANHKENSQKMPFQLSVRPTQRQCSSVHS